MKILDLIHTMGSRFALISMFWLSGITSAYSQERDTLLTSETSFETLAAQFVGGVAGTAVGFIPGGYKHVANYGDGVENIAFAFLSPVSASLGIYFGSQLYGESCTRQYSSALLGSAVGFVVGSLSNTVIFFATKELDSPVLYFTTYSLSITLFGMWLYNNSTCASNYDENETGMLRIKVNPYISCLGKGYGVNFTANW